MVPLGMAMWVTSCAQALAVLPRQQSRSVLPQQQSRSVTTTTAQQPSRTSWLRLLPTSGAAITMPQSRWEAKVEKGNTAPNKQAASQSSHWPPKIGSAAAVTTTTAASFGWWLTFPTVAAWAVSGGGLDYAGTDISNQDFSNGNYKGKDFTQGACRECINAYASVNPYIDICQRAGSKTI